MVCVTDVDGKLFLLIEPQGIEIKIVDKCSTAETFLLIEPQGIEIQL